MRSLGRLILGHMISGIKKMNRVKEFEDDAMETPLKRCLTTFDITLLGKLIFLLHIFSHSCQRFSLMTQFRRDILFQFNCKKILKV